MVPTKIKVRDKEYLDVTWNDGEKKSIKLK